MYNNSEVKKNFMAVISIELDRILEEGFGELRLVYDKKRGVQDVIPSPRIRVKH